MEFKPEFDALQPYFKAFWNCEVLDREAVSVYASRRSQKSDDLLPDHLEPYTVFHESADFIIDCFEHHARNTFFGGLAIPVFWPNLGPDVFSAFLGADLKFSPDSPGTSWIDWHDKPLKDYTNLDVLEIRDDNVFYKKVLDLTRLAVQRGKGKYIVGITDLHAGFDALAVLRGGPDQASLDLVEEPEGVQAAMVKLFAAWKKVVDDTWAILKTTQTGQTNWMNIYAPGKSLVVQNDFSCLVSPGMYREFLLDELVKEIDDLDYTIYHLDGEEALQHLDILLEIPKLNAIQWVAGAKYANVSIEKWFPLFQKIQSKGKAIVVYPKLHEVDLVLKNLKPEGLLVQVGCDTEDQAHEILKKTGWKN